MNFRWWISMLSGHISHSPPIAHHPVSEVQNVHRAAEDFSKISHLVQSRSLDSLVRTQESGILPRLARSAEETKKVLDTTVERAKKWH